MKKIPALAALDALLATIHVEKPKQPDEFTAREIHAALRAKGDTRSLNTIRLWLPEQAQYGSRTILVKGHATKVFRLR